MDGARVRTQLGTRLARDPRTFWRPKKGAKKNLENAPAERPEALWKPVLGRNLEDLHGDANEHRELKYQHSTRQTAAGERNETRQSALPPTVPPVCGSQSKVPLRDVVLEDLGHFDNLLGNRMDDVALVSTM